jgi:uncharacterized membrane protein
VPERRERWVWGRVAGDMMDLTLLATAFGSDRTRHTNVATATAAVVGVTALDVLCGQQLSRTRPGRGPGGQSNGLSAGHRRHIPGLRVTRSVTVRRPVREVYAFWRDLENLPRFMRHVESVRVMDETYSHWTVKAPAGRTVEWDAEIVEDRPNEAIGWRSVAGASVQNAGHVRFRPAPGDRGTEVHIELQYQPPGGRIGAAIAWLTGEEPRRQVEDDLFAFKQVMETGDIVRSDSSIHDGPYPAQPSRPSLAEVS